MGKKLVILKQENDFKQFRSSKSFSDSNLRIRIRSANQNTPRFGFIVPKKTVPKAADRNKIKRRIKNILQKNLQSMKSADVLIFPNATTGRKKFIELESQIINLLKKARIWIS
ncbi:MAG: ribonuclease P protein component [bacterium]|nr:ribonuclease P protein component [bacterium]